MKKTMIALTAIATFIPALTFASCLPEYRQRVLQLQDELTLDTEEVALGGLGYLATYSTSGAGSMALSSAIAMTDALYTAKKLEETKVALATIIQLRIASGVQFERLVDDVLELRYGSSEDVGILRDFARKTKIVAIGVLLDEKRAFCNQLELANYEEIVASIAGSL